MKFSKALVFDVQGHHRGYVLAQSFVVFAKSGAAVIKLQAAIDTSGSCQGNEHGIVAIENLKFRIAGQLRFLGSIGNDTRFTASGGFRHEVVIMAGTDAGDIVAALAGHDVEAVILIILHLQVAAAAGKRIAHDVDAVA